MYSACTHVLTDISKATGEGQYSCAAKITMCFTNIQTYIRSTILGTAGKFGYQGYLSTCRMKRLGLARCGFRSRITDHWCESNT